MNEVVYTERFVTESEREREMQVSMYRFIDRDKK